jgi:hypothetical protein
MEGKNSSIAAGMPAELLLEVGKEYCRSEGIKAEMKVIWLVACISCGFPSSLDLLLEKEDGEDEDEEPPGAFILDALDEGLDAFTGLFQEQDDFLELNDPRFAKLQSSFDNWYSQLSDVWELDGTEWEHVGEEGWSHILGQGLPFFGGHHDSKGEGFDFRFRPWLGLGQGRSQCSQEEVNSVSLGSQPIGRCMGSKIAKSDWFWRDSSQEKLRWPRLSRVEVSDDERVAGVIWPPFYPAGSFKKAVARKCPREIGVTIPEKLPVSGGFRAFVNHFESMPVEITTSAPLKTDLFELYKTDVRVGFRNRGEAKFREDFMNSKEKRVQQVAEQRVEAYSNSPTLSHVASFAILNLSNGLGQTPRVLRASARLFLGLSEESRGEVTTVLGIDSEVEKKFFSEAIRDASEWDDDEILCTADPASVKNWGEFFGDDDLSLGRFVNVYRFFRVFINREEESLGKCVRVNVSTTEADHVTVDFTERSISFQRFRDEETPGGKRVWRCVSVIQVPKAVTKYRAIQPVLAYTFGVEAEQEMAPRLFKTAAWSKGLAKTPGCYGGDEEAALELQRRFPRSNKFFEAMLETFDMGDKVGRIVAMGSGKGLGSGKSVAAALSSGNCRIGFVMRAFQFFNSARLGSRVIPSFWEAVHRNFEGSEEDSTKFLDMVRMCDLFTEAGDPTAVRFKLDDIEKGSKELPPSHCPRGFMCTDVGCAKIHVPLQCRYKNNCRNKATCYHLHTVKYLVSKDSLARAAYESEMRSLRGINAIPFKPAICRSAASRLANLEPNLCVPVADEDKPFVEALVASAARNTGQKGGRKGRGKARKGGSRRSRGSTGGAGKSAGKR